MDSPPEKPTREVTLTVPDEETQRDVLQIWQQVDRLSRHADIPTIRAGAAVQPQDADSALVEREWRRAGRRGLLAQRTMEGEQVKAAWLDDGRLRRAAGTVRRNAAGELVVESWADGVRRETPVPRDANVDRCC